MGGSQRAQTTSLSLHSPPHQQETKSWLLQSEDFLEKGVESDVETCGLEEEEDGFLEEIIGGGNSAVPNRAPPPRPPSTPSQRLRIQKHKHEQCRSFCPILNLGWIENWKKQGLFY